MCKTLEYCSGSEPFTAFNDANSLLQRACHLLTITGMLQANEKQIGVENLILQERREQCS